MTPLTIRGFRVERNRWIAIALTLSAVALVVIGGLTAFPVPAVSLPVPTTSVIFPSPSKGVPTVNATLHGTLTADGSVSADSPVAVELSLNSNTTNLLNYYSFLELIDSAGGGVYLPVRPANGLTGVLGQQTNTSSYSISGNVTFRSPGAVYYGGLVGFVSTGSNKSSCGVGNFSCLPSLFSGKAIVSVPRGASL